ncbi:glycoside hydrolase [Pseudomonas asiatica]|uniref:sialidase family protein n=1 Tax=Pseudomonas asiatica TaxID=2219225 RepID=UPI00209B77D7|nr:sialidase family protein [Pseudomonas asiatica]MCO7536716.1 glycoside hydrolase [Pseudomonas asiatica]MCO7550469.1 glycoside hydrolase [Pseudomonas asiatica]MCO7560030.1 glycoside hydrolase [Pseudomonas asiatica]
MRYNTGNPVGPDGSSSPFDLHDNSGIVDLFVNGDGDTYIDRKGRTALSLKGISKEAATASVSVDAAQKAIQAALDADHSAQEASDSASLAQAAVDAAASVGNLYPSTAAGLAATINGQYFSVVSASTQNYMDLYLNSAGSAVFQKSYPALEFFQEALLGVKELTTVETDDGVVYDSLGQHIMHVLRNSKFSIATNDGRIVLDVDSESVHLPGGLIDSRNNPVIIDLKRGLGASLSILCEGKEILAVDTKTNEVRVSRLVADRLDVNVIDVAAAEPAPTTIYCPNAPELYFDNTNPLFNTRKWQGIPSIARSGSRLWCTFYGGVMSGGGEGPGNFVIVSYSDNEGDTWVEHMYIAYANELTTKRVFDPQIWLDPEGVLWVFVAVSGDGRLADGVEGAWAFTCKNPRAEIPNWSTGWRLSYYGVPMMPARVNERVLIPIDYWGISRGTGLSAQRPELVGRRIFDLDYRSRRATLLSKLPPVVADVTYDESNLGQAFNGSLRAVYRVPTGAETTVSMDGGVTWSAATSYLGAVTSSRAYYGSTPSGRIAICYNDSPDRNNLTLKLSEDGGVTFPYSCLIDSRTSTSYPEVTYGEGGEIYIAYDLNRTVDKQVLMAIVLEHEVIAGTASPITKIVSDQ